MAEDVGFIPLDLGDFDSAVESQSPPKIQKGKYLFQLNQIEFHEALTGRTGLRAICQITEHDDPAINGRTLRYDGWWGTGFLTNLLLAFGGPDKWPEIRAEMSDPEGLKRIRDNDSMVINSLVGRTVEGSVDMEKGQDGESWPRIKRFTISKAPF